jgi:nucleotide-binding universal stress UspA family protein
MTPIIVVGVDGSPGADAALRWAWDEAQRRHAQLNVVHAWTIPYVGELGWTSAAVVSQDALKQAAKATLADSLERVVPPGSHVIVHEVIAEGSAAAVLREQANDADLLVVGSRGRGGFAGLVLGSVSQQCAHHSPCPVVIVPPEAMP